MHTLYLSLILMLLLALLMVAIPFWRHKNLLSKHFFLAALLIVIVAGSLYYYSNTLTSLTQWFAKGREHYHLQETLKDLGGIDGMISRIEEKLVANPNDAEGWFILGKLYLTKQDSKTAAVAFRKAHVLKPNDDQINYYYNLTTKDTPTNP